MSSILNSTKLIKSIERRAAVPIDQLTFTEEDLLEMATEEINIGLMSYLMEAYEGYLVYFEDVSLITGQNRYSIPARAHGNKLKELALVSINGSKKEMFQIHSDESSDYGYPMTGNDSRYFYVENNDVVLMTGNFDSSDSLRFYFYMRPNQLVINKRVGAVTNITNSIEIDSISAKSGAISNISVTANAVITSVSHGLQTGNKVIITGSNSTPSVDGIQLITVIDSNTFSIPVTTTIAGNSGSWQKAIDVKVVGLDNFPTHFTTDISYDIVQNVSPNIIIDYDIQINSIDQTQKTLSIPLDSFDTRISKGFYVSKAEETFVPNIPTELHPILAQRVAIACLEAQGDEASKVSAERKLEQMEKNSMVIVNNRVESAPIKIRNRHSPLNQTGYTGLGRSRQR